MPCVCDNFRQNPVLPNSYASELLVKLSHGGHPWIRDLDMMAVVKIFPYFTHGCINPWVWQGHFIKHLSVRQLRVNKLLMPQMPWESSSTLEALQKPLCKPFRITPREFAKHSPQLEMGFCVVLRRKGWIEQLRPRRRKFETGCPSEFLNTRLVDIATWDTIYSIKVCHVKRCIHVR